MRLSEAIREGAKKRPQGFYNYFTRAYALNGDGSLDWQYHSCVLGAAYEGISGRVKPSVDDETVNTVLRHHVGVSFSTSLPDGTGHLIAAMTGLNDQKKWSREKIADWLEGLGY